MKLANKGNIAIKNELVKYLFNENWLLFLEVLNKSEISIDTRTINDIKN